MTSPRGYTQKDVASLRGTRGVSTNKLDATDTQDVIKLGEPAAKITYQTKGGLACTVEVSLNGDDWTALTAGSSTMISYDTHNVTMIRATRTGGEGYLLVAAS